MKDQAGRRQRLAASVDDAVSMRRPRPSSSAYDGFEEVSGTGRASLRVGLLGGFRVSVGARTIAEDTWRLRKARSLVALLALEPGHRMHRERIMDVLWPRLDAGAAANNLRYALHVARRVLDPDPAAATRYLRHQGGLLALSPDSRSWVDVETFEEAAATARRLREPAAYRVAIELYSGELLPQDRYEDWAEDRREELRRLRLDMLVESARLYEERGELAPAIEALRRVVEEDRTHEATHVGLMRLQALAGRSAGLPWRPPSRGPDKTPGDAGILARIPCSRKESREGPERRHNLPAPRTSFVGRERELVEVGRLLSMTRLLTLTGAGGSGKTRLALEVAGRFVDVYPDGVWLVELASLSDGALAPQAFAGALGVREQPGRSLAETLAETLRERSLLLVVDNCEHLVEEAAQLMEGLLDACPGLRVLATSREVLGVAGELTWRVPSLSLPDLRRPPTAPELALHGASRLFVERARLYRPGFMLTAENGRAVAEICHRLDGIPLAIELAAARMGVLSAAQISERLGDSLDLLSGGARTATPRQKTLRGALDWSHKLLVEPERKLFGRLSVFAGGFTLEAAEVVGAGDGIAAGEVLDLLSSLVDKSLVLTDASKDADGSPRYRLLEPVRQYARERTEQSGEVDEVRRRHAAFFLALAEEVEPESKGTRREAWLRRLEIEYGNLRAALGWMLQRGEDGPTLRMGGALGDFWYTRGHLDEGQRWLEAVLASGGLSPASARVKVLTGAGYIAWEQGDYERATALGEEGLALSQRSGDSAGAAAALHTLGTVALHRNECGEAAALLEEALALRRSLGDTMGVGRVLQALGVTAAVRQDFERAVALHEEGLPLAREMEDRLGIALFLGQGALAYLGRGDHRRADALCAEGIELSWQLEHEHTLIFVLHIAAVLAVARGRPNRAARLWGAAEALREAAGATLSHAARHHYEPYIDAARAQLDDEPAWEAARAQGEAMTLDEVIEYALSAKEEVDASQRSSPEEGSSERKLTPRESKVAALVSRGLSNRQIASELVISERTVAAHLRRVFKKLKLHSRAQLAAWAAKRDLTG